MSSIKRALISLSDKTGAVEFAQTLTKLGVEILSTGGTAKLLADAGVPVIEVADYTGFPEMLDGRVKTLHPKIHGGILGRRDLDEHVAKMEEHGISNIDLVCVNLYPFAATIAKPNCTLEDAIENIDIGGPTMVRSAAKNWKHVAIVTDTADFPAIAAELEANNGALSDKTRFNLSRKAFSHTAQYDGMISNYLTSLSDDVLSGTPQIGEFPSQFNQSWIKVQDMRYGENPHQRAAFYRDIYPAAGSLSAYKQLQGKELSYNNIADADAAWEAVKSFDAPACVIVKHANPCGVAIASNTLDAYKLAYATDTTSAFGGIIAFNREVDGETVKQITDNQFMEVLMAPKFTAEALEIAAAKKNVRVLEVPLEAGANRFELKTRRRRTVGTNPRYSPPQPRRFESRLQTPTDRARMERPDVCMERRKIRQIQRHRLRQRRSNLRHRRRPNEPRGQYPHRRPQSARCQSRPQRRMCRFRCLLPIPRRRRCHCRAGHQSHHPSGRLHARPRSL